MDLILGGFADRGMADLDDTALDELSRRLRVRIRPVILPFPEAAIDVDTIADQRLVEGITGSER